MAYNLYNEKFGSCLKGIKSCLKSLKNHDYEYVSYEKQTNTVRFQLPETINQLSHNRSKSKSVNDIQQLNQHRHNLKKQKAIDNLTLNEFDILSKFQSTHIHNVSTSSANIFFEDDDSMYYSCVDLLHQKDHNKISSSFSNLSAQQASNSQLSTGIQRTCSITSFETATDDFEFTQYQSYANSSELKYNSGCFLQTSQSSANNQGLLHSESLFVCIIPHKSDVQGDLNLNYADRVQLIHSFNGMSLVQNITTKQCGYVPTNSIILLSNFLN